MRGGERDIEREGAGEGERDMKKRKKTKKKGRPSLIDLRMRNLKEHNNNINKSPITKSDPNSSPNLDRRSTRRNPNLNSESSDSDDDERKEKKLKLVERLTTSNSTSHGSDSCEINASGDRSAPADDDVVAKTEKVTEALQGSLLESGPTLPLPDKKLLVFILDRLQKKDTYGVFSEPVDLDELPDYHEIIKNPMDFGTLRKKLDEGCYSNLDAFESDVILICTNAMEYNAPETVYFRQAKLILDIAKRDFQYLRQVNEEGEPQPKIVRRGRPPNLKKALNSSPLERQISNPSSSDATLATAAYGDNNSNINNVNASGSNSYNLRKAVPSFRFQSMDASFSASPQSRNYETYNYKTDWNSEFPVKILKAEAKHGKKQFTSDENRRATYKQFDPSAFGHNSSSLATLDGNMKQLIGVGLYSDHGYARSLARFAANLGPVAWKIASKKIERALPSSVSYGPGWVGENEALPPQQHHRSEVASLEALAGQSSYNEQSVTKNSFPRIGSGAILEAQQKQFLQNRNGFNQLLGYDYSTQAEMLKARFNMGTGVLQSSFEEAHPMAPNHSNPGPIMGSSSSQSPRLFSAPGGMPAQQHTRFQEPGSSNSSFPIGSPQPDLALQL